MKELYINKKELKKFLKSEYELLVTPNEYWGSDDYYPDQACAETIDCIMDWVDKNSIEFSKEIEK